MQKIIGQIAAELGAAPQQVAAAVELLDGGATVPFIARYRKEATGGLDDTQLRTLQERLTYLRELQDRRGAVLKAIDEQGKLTDALRAAIDQARACKPRQSLYLIPNRYGRCHVSERGDSKAWDKSWRRSMARAIEQTDLERPFTRHDLRANF